MTQTQGIPAHLYGVGAVLLISRIMETLVEKGVLTSEERSTICALASGGLKPADDPGVQAMRAMLQQMAGGSGSTQ